MSKFPDKHQYKTTITNTLRSQIIEISKTYNTKPSYLEIGCDVGYTMFSICDNFSICVGIDIDPERIHKSLSVREQVEHDTSNVLMMCGTSNNIPENNYDIILIDAGHDYDNINNDVQNIIKYNTSKEYFMIFHDYGLVNADVKKYLMENFPNAFYLCGEEKDWNKLGGMINDYEAAIVRMKINEIK